MLIGAGAVSTLVNFIDEDYDGRKEGDIVFMIAIDSINYLFTWENLLDKEDKIDLSNTLIRHSIFDRIMTNLDYLLSLVENSKEDAMSKYLE